MKYLLVLVPFLSFAEISFKKDVRPIFSAKCSSCHNASSDLGDWTDYDQAYDKRYVIKNRIQSKSMPHFTDESLTESMRSIIVDWVDTGAKK